MDSLIKVKLSRYTARSLTLWLCVLLIMVVISIYLRATCEFIESTMELRRVVGTRERAKNDMKTCELELQAYLEPSGKQEFDFIIPLIVSSERILFFVLQPQITFSLHINALTRWLSHVGTPMRLIGIFGLWPLCNLHRMPPAEPSTSRGGERERNNLNLYTTNTHSVSYLLLVGHRRCAVLFA